MSAPAEITEGSITTDGTEQTLVNISGGLSGGGGIYTLQLDTSAMLSGDSITLRAYKAANSNGPSVLSGSITYTDVQDVPLKIFGPFTINAMNSVWGLIFTVERTTGTDEVYLFSVEGL